MGCWNNDNCRQPDPTRPKGIIGSNDGRDYRRAVIEAMGRKDPRYAFGLVAGDNIYPRMPSVPPVPLVPPGANLKRITKVYYKKTLDYGFGLLDGLKIPYYTAYGNHDVVKNEVLQGELRRVAGRKNKKHHAQYVAEVVPGKLRVVVIDTNLLQLELTEPTKRLYGIQTVAEGWRVMSRFLDDTLQTPFKGWTVVMGHEPFFTMKDGGLVGLVYYKELIQTLIAIPRVVYVCADLHAFQVSEVSLAGVGAATLPMVVVGTGGANPDEVKTPSAPIQFEGGTWRVLDTVPAYGYCEGTVRGNQLHLTFLPLNHCTKGQQKVRVILRATDKKPALEVRRLGRRIAYDPEKCAARPVLPELCVNDPRKNTPLEGVGRYVRRPYKINQKK